MATLLETLAADNSDPTPNDASVMVICPECGGQGGEPGENFGDHGWHPCYHCHGTGLVRHQSGEVPADVEPTGPAPDDQAWWAGQQTGGCGVDDLSPEEQLIAMSMSALQYRLDQCGDDYANCCRYEAGVPAC